MSTTWLTSKSIFFKIGHFLYYAKFLYIKKHILPLLRENKEKKKLVPWES